MKCFKTLLWVFSLLMFGRNILFRVCVHFYFIWSLPPELVCVCSGSAEVVSAGVFGEGTGLILLDDVECEGTEASLLECKHGVWGRHDCSHSEDVGIRCHRAENNEVPLAPETTGKSSMHTHKDKQCPALSEVEIHFADRLFCTGLTLCDIQRGFKCHLLTVVWNK